MVHSNAVSDHLPRISEFYNDKSIFLTGAAGFVGSILLENLLRCCPGIKSIYILLRVKKNVQTKQRKENIFKKKIFQKIKEETPELLQKVFVIPGDISFPNLGMNENEKHLILQEVSIVFHCAAVLSFDRPLEFVLKNNVLSVRNIIGLCREMKKFKALVYTSTAYSNSNLVMFPIKEEIYRLPINVKRFLVAIRNGDERKLQKLISRCKPDWPSWYAFSKCLAENVIAETASDLPVAIVRPSLIISTWKNPIPGYLENHFGISTLFVGLGKGFLRVGNVDPNCKLNFVPADIVANAHVLAACSVGIQGCASLLVLNCTATENLYISNLEWCRNVVQLVHKNPLPLSFNEPTFPRLVKNKYLYFVLSFYYHYLPATVLDWISRFLGKKPRILSLYRSFDMVMDQLNYFMCHEFQFERENMEILDKSIHFEDKKDLNLDFKQATFQEMSSSFPEGSAFYNWNIDDKFSWGRKTAVQKRNVQIRGIQGIFLMICCLLIFKVLFSIFK